jgi:putative membrane protein
MKINAFEITPRRVAILGWSVCLCVVFLLLQFSENYGQHIDELSADGFSVASAATDVSPLLRICGVAVAICSVVAWEQLRHALLKANHYWLQLMQIVVMVLTILGAAVAIMPSGATLLSSFGKFQMALPFYNDMAIGAASLCLGIGIARKFGGRIRLYGIALAVLPVLSMLVGEFYTYLYTSVGGLTLPELENYRVVKLIVQLCIQVALWVLLYRSFASNED